MAIRKNRNKGKKREKKMVNPDNKTKKFLYFKNFCVKEGQVK